LGGTLEKSGMIPDTHETEPLYKKIVDATPMGMALFTNEFAFVYANPVFYTLTGTTEQEWLFANVTTMPLRCALQSATESLATFLDSNQKKPLRIKITAKQLDDQHILYTLTDSPAKNASDLQREITEKTVFLEGLLSNLPIILYQIDANGYITTSMGAGLQVVPGWNNDLLVGVNGFELAKDMTEAFQRAANGEANRALNAFNIDGNDYYFDTMVLPDSTCDGGIIGFAVDVTATKLAEKALAESHLQLREQAAALELQNKFKNKILAIISHDLRQPMSSIISLTRLFHSAEQNLTDEDLEMIFLNLNDTAQKGIQLLEGLLCWVHSEKEGFVYRGRPMPLKNILEQANGIYQYDQKKKQLSFINDVPEELTIYAHSQMLLFVVRNLIGNATKYSPQGGTIRAYASIKQQQAVFSLSDNGPGIGEVQLENLFNSTIDPLEIGQENPKGAGVALSICQDLIHCMGGRIWAESDPGNGSIFFCSLPAENRYREGA